MAWNDEIKSATYTSPSGKVFTFFYETSVSKETDLKTATFTFPEKDGALVVPLGLGGRRFPMTCSFYGANCLTEADAFEAGLEERGYGELQHPVYGVRKVVPTGSIKRSNDLKSGLNVSTVEIVFAETIIDETFPDSKVVSVDKIEGSMEALVQNAAAEFNKDLDTSNLKEVIRTQNKLQTSVDNIEESINAVAMQSKSVYTEVQQVETELSASISSITENPEAVVFQTYTILEQPSKIAVDAESKIEQYNKSFNDVLKGLESDSLGVKAAINQFATTKMLLAGIVGSLASGVAFCSFGSGFTDFPISGGSRDKGSSFSLSDSESVNNAIFRCREDAVNAAASIAELYDKFVEFCDSKIKEDYQVDTGETYNYLRDVVNESIDVIINASFDLPTRKLITTERDHQIMELLAELYGNFDHLDEFILDNQLTYDEIELIPMGRQVVYYV